MPPKKARKKAAAAPAGGRRKKRAAPKRRKAGGSILADPRLYSMMHRTEGKHMYGSGFFGDLWDGIKNVASKVKPSQVLGLIPHPGAQAAAATARTVGLGRHGGAMQAPPEMAFRTQPVPFYN